MSFTSRALDQRLVFAVAAALALAGCAKKKEEPVAEAPAAEPAAAAETLEGQVDIVAWPGYIERGETDKSYDWVSAFETETGCKVNIKTAGTSDEMVSLMTQGGYDLVTASGDASLRLIRGGTVQPVDGPILSHTALIGTIWPSTLINAPAGSLEGSISISAKLFNPRRISSL